MSCYEWERGTIKLPTAEAVAFRNAIKKAVEDYTTRLYDTTQRFWKMLPAKVKRDPQLYSQWVYAFCNGNNPRSDWGYNSKVPNMEPLERGGPYGRFGFTEDVSSLLSWHATRRPKKNPTPHEGLYEQCPPRRILQSDVVAYIGKATGTSFRINCGDEPSFTIKGRVIEWDVPDNNHACEHGREHPLAQKLFELLARVKWTRGSGGKIIGNNEYNRDSDHEGGGGNYVVDTFGPQTKAAPRRRRTPSVARLGIPR